jgi:D-alanyl-D-alanine carboxypeptidase
VSVVALAALLLAGCASAQPSDAMRATDASAAASTSGKPFDKKARSTTAADSLWVVVNKKHPLTPVDYAPTDLVYPDLPNPNHQPLRRAAAEALMRLSAAAGKAGLALSIESGYRSYQTQVEVYGGWVAARGQAAADEVSARPGTSEHQTGLAVDLAAVPPNCSLAACFGTTPHGTWLAANAWRYGFLLRYPADKVDVTGYDYEPWHFRFVGVALATKLHQDRRETLEEFFGVSGGRRY